MRSRTLRTANKRRQTTSCEVLEQRSLLSAIVVNTIADPSIPVVGTVSLREAIAQASDGDTITFDPILTSHGAVTIGLLQGHLTIDKSVEIVGPGNTLLSISGNQSSRVFDVAADAGTVGISGVSIINGSGLDPAGPANSGGGIFNQATLSLTDCVISNCICVSGNGGGIYNAGPLTLNHCVIRNNRCNVLGDHQGGGIYSVENLTLIDTTVSDNSTGKGYCQGGGIRIDSDTATTLIVGSTISGNSANGGGGVTHTRQGLGGGVNSRGPLTFINSTIEGNFADSIGGIDAFGSLALTNCTVTRNTGGGIEGVGLLNNTIVSGNNANGAPADAGAVSAASAYNLFGSPVFGISNGVNGNIVGVVDPKLGPLVDNGGPCETALPVAGSPAIDAGSNALALDATGSPLVTDQRGMPRVAGSTVDIGSVELASGETSPLLEPTIRSLLPAGLVMSQTVKRKVTILLTNAGTTRYRGQTTIALSLVPDTSPSGTEINLTSIQRSLNLKPLHAVKINLRIGNLPTETGGNFLLRARVTDASRKQTVATASQGVFIDSPAIELNDSLKRSPASATVGKMATFALSIQNLGNVPAVGNVTLRLTLNPDNPSDSIPIDGWSKRLKLAAGRKTSFRARFKMPVIPAVGQYFLIVHFAGDNALIPVNPSADQVIRTPLNIGLL